MSNRDSVQFPLQWMDDHNLLEFAGSSVRLCFHVPGAKLYSFGTDSHPVRRIRMD